MGNPEPTTWQSEVPSPKGLWDLPPELFRDVYKYLSTDIFLSGEVVQVPLYPSLSNLALTRKALNDLITPYLYQKVVFVLSENQGEPRGLKRVPRFFQTCHDNPALEAHICKMGFYWHERERDPELLKIFKALARLPNLQGAQLSFSRWPSYLPLGTRTDRKNNNTVKMVWLLPSSLRELTLKYHEKDGVHYSYDRDFTERRANYVDRMAFQNLWASHQPFRFPDWLYDLLEYKRSIFRNLKRIQAIEVEGRHSSKTVVWYQQKLASKGDVEIKVCARVPRNFEGKLPVHQDGGWYPWEKRADETENEASSRVQDYKDVIFTAWKAVTSKEADNSVICDEPPAAAISPHNSLISD